MSRVPLAVGARSSASSFFGVSHGHTEFFNSSTAGNGTFINNSAPFDEDGSTDFFNTSTAGNSTLIHGANFYDDSKGGSARVVELLFIDLHNAPGVTVGSIEGDSFYLDDIDLGANNLTVGSNNLSTTFSGTIGYSGESGSITKVGTGTLTLSGANSYTGGTTIKNGTLLVKKTSSGTGSGKVAVNTGTFGGTGTISGAVTVGKGNGPGAFLSPGINGVGTLTIRNTLTFKLDGIYKFELKSNNATADNVIAQGCDYQKRCPVFLCRSWQ